LSELYLFPQLRVVMRPVLAQRWRRTEDFGGFNNYNSRQPSSLEGIVNFGRVWQVRYYLGSFAGGDFDWYIHFGTARRGQLQEEATAVRILAKRGEQAAAGRPSCMALGLAT
jgi:hypothetical protein